MNAWKKLSAAVCAAGVMLTCTAELLPAQLSVSAMLSYSGKCGENLQYALKGDYETLEIIGSGAMDDFEKGQAPWYVFLTTDSRAVMLEPHQKLFIDNTVTHIGDYAFYDMEFRQNPQEIPASVKSIGSYAFSDARNLQSITIENKNCTIGAGAIPKETQINAPAGAKALAYAKANGNAYTVTTENAETEDAVVDSGAAGTHITWTLYESGLLELSGEGKMAAVHSSGNMPWEKYKSKVTAVKIDERITGLTFCTFNEMTNLAEIYIPAGIEDIGSASFNRCTSLKAINVAAENPAYCSVDGILYNKDKTTLIAYPAGRPDTKFTVPEGVTTVDSYAFESSVNLEEITVPEGVTTISSNSFSDGKKLKKVTLPDTVTSIPFQCFLQCESLTDIRLPETLTRISGSAFSGCKSLPEIMIPKSVTTIETGVFSGCKSLIAIHVDEENENYCDVNGVLFDKLKTTLLCCPGGYEGTAYTIPGTVTKIASGAFNGCTALTTAFIPDHVTSLGTAAFFNCSNLKTVRIGSGLQKLDTTTFSYCSALEEIVIPKNITSLGYHVFDSCYKLQRVLVLNPDCQFDTSSSSIISYSPKAVLYGVKGSTTEDYTSERALQFKEYIRGDVNGDGEVTKDDADLILEEYGNAGAGLDSVLTAEAHFLADVNYDGAVDAIDSSWVLARIESGRFPDEDAAEILPEGIAARGACGENLTWQLDTEGTLTVSGKGEMTNWKGTPSVNGNEGPDNGNLYSISFSGDPVPWFSKRKNIQKVVIESGVTSIGDFAFVACENLTDVSIADTVTTIGKRAFYHCIGLPSVTLPEGVKTLSEYAFCECTAMTEVTLPDSLTELESSVFQRCFAMTAFKVSTKHPVFCVKDGVLFSKDMTELVRCPNGITGHYKIPDGVKTIISEAFMMCRTLTSVSIPESVTAIGSGAFWSCEMLNGIRLPSGVTSLAYGTFIGCKSLKRVYLPETVTSIGQAVFSSCDGLQDITVLNPDAVFYNSGNLAPVDTVIHGYADSTAQLYANNQKYMFLVYLRGDADCDGKVTDADAELILSAYSAASTGQDSPLSAGGTVNADVNYDGIIDARDASAVETYLKDGAYTNEEPQETEPPVSITTTTTTTTTTAKPTTTTTTVTTTTAKPTTTTTTVTTTTAKPTTTTMTVTTTTAKPTTTTTTVTTTTAKPTTTITTVTTTTAKPTTTTMTVTTTTAKPTTTTTTVTTTTAKPTTTTTTVTTTTAKPTTTTTTVTTTTAKPTTTTTTVTTTTAEPVTETTTITTATLPATSGTFGEQFTWAFDAETGTLTLSGEGTLKAALVHPWDAFAAKIAVISAESGITEIESGAFAGLTAADIYIWNSACVISPTAGTAKTERIHGYSVSTAADFATQTGCEFLPVDLRGDANCDGKITDADADLILDHYSEVSSGNASPLSRQGMVNADIDGDGAVDATDASAVIHFVKYGKFPNDPTGYTYALECSADQQYFYADDISLFSSFVHLNLMLSVTDQSGTRKQYDISEYAQFRTDADSPQFPAILCNGIPGRYYLSCMVYQSELQQSALAEQYPDMVSQLFESYADGVMELLIPVQCGVRGDATLDGTVSVVDARYALICYTESLAGLDYQIHADKEQDTLAKMMLDVNNDGTVDAKDAQLILMYYLRGLVGFTQKWEDVIPAK